MSATISDVADAAGVDVSTVSRVLNGRDDTWVSEETRRRIMDAAQQLGYRTNPFASALRSGRSPVIVFILGMQSDQAMAIKAWTLHEAVTRLGREVLTTHFAGANASERISELLETIRPAAVSWLHPSLGERACRLIADLHTDGTHVLLMDCPSAPPPDLPCDALIVDRCEGARLATAHLLERGHGRIGIIAAPGSTRLRGYHAALADAGIEEHFEEPFEGSADPAAGERAAARLLRRHPEITALFCHSDLVAVGALKTLRQMGYEVPQRIAVVGFDDDPWADYLPVSLTTLSHPVEEMRQRTRDLLSARLEGDDAPFQHILLPPKLIVRESSGPG